MSLTKEAIDGLTLEELVALLDEFFAERFGGPSGKNLGVPFLLRAKDEAEKERWKKAAKRAGKTLTEWLRGLANAAS